MLCVDVRSNLDTCTACLYKRPASLANEDAAGDLAAVTAETPLLESEVLVGFAFYTEDTVVYSGATTAAQHAQILATVLATGDLGFVWMHYDVHLMRAVNALEAEVRAPNGDSAKLRNLFSFDLCRNVNCVNYFTNIQQELENLEAMHRQLPLMHTPAPLDFTGVLGAGSTDEELEERACAFRKPQLVRPVVSTLQRGDRGDRLCAHFVNLAPRGPEDVRMASPMARAPSLLGVDQSDSTYVPGDSPGCFNGDVIKARLVVNSASGFSSSHWHRATEEELESSMEELVNAELRHTLQRGDFPSPELVANLPFMSSPMYARDDNGRPHLPGSSTVTWSPHVSTASPDIDRCSPAGRIRLVDSGALLHKQPCAYAKRLTRLGCIDTARACGHFGEVRVELPYARSAWTDEDLLESLLWKQRVGWPLVAGAPYFLSVAAGYHFFRTLWVRESDDVMLLLPMYNFLMLRGHAGTCVPLHWTDGDEAKYANLRSLRFARSAVEDDMQLLRAFDAIQSLLVSLISGNVAADAEVGGVPERPRAEYVRRGSDRNLDEFKYVNGIADTFEELKTKLPTSAWFSDPANTRDCAWCGEGAQGIWCTEWLLRRLFLRQMRRICEEKGLSAKSVDLVVHQFDETAGWPAFEVERQTYFVYSCCTTVKDDVLNHKVDVNGSDETRVVVDRELVLSNLSDADEAAVQSLMSTYEQSGDRVDRMSIVRRDAREGEAPGYFMAFSAYCTNLVLEYNEKKTTPFIMLRTSKSLDEQWPLCYYARGAEFLATNSLLDEFCRDPSVATYLKSLPILKIISAPYETTNDDDREILSMAVETTRDAPGALAELAERVVDVTTHKLAFSIARSDQSERKGLFVLELYDANDTLRGAAVVARLADSNMADSNMTLNCLELVAAYGETDSGGQPSAYTVDQTLRDLGCSHACADDALGAVRIVLERLAACWGVECLVRASRHTRARSGLEFLGRPFPDREPMSGSIVLYARDHQEKRQHVVRLRALESAAATKRPATKRPGALADRVDRHYFYLFAAPSTKTQRRNDLPPAEEGAPSPVSGVRGTYRPTGLVFHGGVCEMLADGVEPVALRRAPTFTRRGDASTESNAAVTKHHGNVTDYGSPTARPAAIGAFVDLARLINRHQGETLVCVRVCFEDAARAVMSHLRACHTHAVVLSVYGVELTTLPKLTILSREPVMCAFREFACDGAFEKHAPWDRRFAFVGGDGVVFGVVLLHVGTAGMLTGLHTTVPLDVAHQPGSYVCRAGEQIWFPASLARPTVDRTIEVSDGIFYNAYLGDKWVLSAVGAAPPSGEARARSYTAVDGRAWDGEATRSWSADAIRLDSDGRLGWNCGAFQCVTPGRLAGDMGLSYEGNGGFRLFRTRERFDVDVPRTDVPSTRAHIRGFLGEPLSIDDSTERVTIYLGERCNATIRVFVLLEERAPELSETMPLPASIRRELHAAMQVGAGSFEVDVCSTRLTSIGDMPVREGEDELAAKADALRTVAPLAFERASGHFLVPGHTGLVLRRLVEVRIGVDVSDAQAASNLRSGAVVGVKRVFPRALSIASAVENRYFSFAATLLNRRAATLEHLAALVASDIGQRIRIRDGVLEVDGRERAASWVDNPENVDGVIEHVGPWTDAAVVVRTDVGERLLSNPSRSFRASSQTVEQLFSSLIRVALARCRQENQ